MALLKQIVAFLIVAVCAVNAADKLQEKFSWKQLDFDFPNENVRAEAIKTGDYVPENNFPLGVERWRNKLFVTCPRFKAGTAATLTYIDLETTTQGKSPKLKPYPNWDAHKLRENNGVTKIVSIFRLNVDICDRLWMLDTGLDGVFDKREQIYGPKIQVYDLNADKQVKEYVLPENVVRDNSFFANLIVDVSKENCGYAMVYIADLASNALVVYDMKSNESWRLTHHFFHFDPLSGDYNVGGVNFQWSYGLFGLALSPVQKDGYRTLYFHPMSSTREFSVSTRILRDKTFGTNVYHEYKVLGSRGLNSQSAGSTLDEATGALFYTLLNKDAIGCWNTNNPEYSPNTNVVLAKNTKTMIFPNDLKIDKTGTLWLTTDRLSNFQYTKLNFNEDNFRIFSAKASEIVEGTACDKKFSP